MDIFKGCGLQIFVIRTYRGDSNGTLRMMKMKGRMVFLLSKGEKEIIKHKGFFCFQRNSSMVKLSSNICFWSGKKTQKLGGGGCKSILKIRLHLLESISERGEAAVFKQKKAEL